MKILIIESALSYRSFYPKTSMKHLPMLLHEATVLLADKPLDLIIRTSFSQNMKYGL